MRKEDGLIVDVSSSRIDGAARNLAACGLPDSVELSGGDAGQVAYPCEPLVV
jgi:predicted O-methyltransferase YrrM